jgi:hypothetical protein
MPRHSRVQSSTMARMRKRRPSVNWVGDEVQAPALVGSQRRLHRPDTCRSPACDPAPADGQPFLAVDPLHRFLFTAIWIEMIYQV